MSDSPILVQTADGVSRITLNRPAVLNSINADLMAGLLGALRTAHDDPSIRCVLLTGAGRGFCAGADLNSTGKQNGPDVPPDAGTLLRTHYHPVIEAMRSLPKPIVAAINGVAAGAGMSLALACDIVLAGESASFLQAFSRIALVPDAGSTWFLPRVAGSARARALAILADKISARDAQDFGIVWKVYPDDELLPEAGRLAARLATQPTQAIGRIKRALDASGGHTLAEQLELEATLQTESMRSEDFQEGVAAFLAKRPPRFQGR